MLKNTKQVGFSSVYNKLVNELSITSLFFYYLAIFYVFSILGLSVKLGQLTANKIIPITELPNLSMAVFVFFSVMAIFLGLIFGIMTNIVGVQRKSNTLIAQIIIAVQHPYSSQNGLSHEDIKHLKSIGEIEQSSAGWKNGFLSIAILWFLLDNNSLFSNQLKTLVSYAEPISKNQSPTLEGFIWSLFWLLVSLISTIISILFYQIVFDFLGHEPVNRVLLKSCEDAKALLETHKLNKKTKLSIKDKKLIASRCGCLYIPASEKDHYEFRTSYATRELKDKDFVLIPSPKLKVEPSKFQFWKRKSR
ncbi:MAG: hypothetical protein K8S20_05255 [Chloroflexi bacterium]|nr:hypothetical protein [Chloroflexota bacterium]